MSKQDTKLEIMELLEENNFYSKMAMQKAGHVGLLVMAVYIIMKENANGKEDKLSKIILTTGAVSSSMTKTVVVFSAKR